MRIPEKKEPTIVTVDNSGDKVSEAVMSEFEEFLESTCTDIVERKMKVLESGISEDLRHELHKEVDNVLHIIKNLISAFRESSILLATRQQVQNDALLMKIEDVQELHDSLESEITAGWVAVVFINAIIVLLGIWAITAL